jgi:flagellin
MITVNSNTLAGGIANNFNRIQSRIDDVTRSIASGKRINSAKDDPAGLFQANALRTQNSSYGVVRNNLTFGTSLLEASSSAITNVVSNLSEMRDLAVQAASGTLSTEGRAALQATFAEFQSQIDSTVNGATVFGQNLVNATAADVDIQSGINAGDTTTVSASSADAATLGVDAGSIDLTSEANAALAITAIDAAVTTAGTVQSTFGAQLNRIDSIDTNVANIMENLEASRSRIEDADVAKLTTELAQLEVQSQLATAVLGIANQMPQQFLALLR